MTERDLEILGFLIGTGEDEYPWAWDPDWPEGATEEDIKEAKRKFRLLKADE